MLVHIPRRGVQTKRWSVHGPLVKVYAHRLFLVHEFQKVPPYFGATLLRNGRVTQVRRRTLFAHPRFAPASEMEIVVHELATRAIKLDEKLGPTLEWLF